MIDVKAADLALNGVEIQRDAEFSAEVSHPRRGWPPRPESLPADESAGLRIAEAGSGHLISFGAGGRSP